MPFGRTELSLRLSVSKFGALSHGQGPRGWFPQGKRNNYGFRTIAVGLVLVKNQKLVKIRFPELSTGAKKSSQVCDLENRVFGETIQKKYRKNMDFYVLRGSTFCGGP